MSTWHVAYSACGRIGPCARVPMTQHRKSPPVATQHVATCRDLEHSNPNLTSRQGPAGATCSVLNSSPCPCPPPSNSRPVLFAPAAVRAYPRTSTCPMAIYGSTSCYSEFNRIANYTLQSSGHYGVLFKSELIYVQHSTDKSDTS
jgi:hypothetical protein